jgi:excisionase family DNA binding protein
MAKRILFTVAEASELLGIGKTKLYELMSEGAVKSVRIGRARRIRYRDLVEFARDLDSDDG